MRSLQADVQNFHEAMGQPVGTGFDEAGRSFRDRFIKEETGETLDAIVNRDMLETIDGLCDCLYVGVGAAVSFGIRLGDFPIEISSSETMTEPGFGVPGDSIALLTGAQIMMTVALLQEDLSVVTPALVGYLASVLAVADRFNVPIRPFWNEVHRSNLSKTGGAIRADGKRLKPPGWTPPNLGRVYLELYGRKLS
jgi:predicted HAD superfamily Cof-like phosphohydrolase